MRVFSKLILIIGLFIVTGCANNDTNRNPSDLEVGGLYTYQNEKGSFSVTKILAQDKFTIHLRIYSNEFKVKPKDINSTELSFLIGHVPMAKEGLLKYKPELLKVEKVSEEELEGYNYYLDAMKN